MNEFELIRQFFQQQPALLPPGHPESLLPPPSPSAGHSLGHAPDQFPGQSPAQSPGQSPGRSSSPSSDPEAAGHASVAPDGPLLGIGDDCALLQLPPGEVLAVSSDMLVAGRHFFEGTDPQAIGHKSLAVNLSDLAAMGAQPLGFTLALALPAVDAGWLRAFSTGLLALASRAACPLVGGDTIRGPLTIAVTVMGRVPDGLALRRDGARPGDDIWVSGALGGAALAVVQRSRGGPVDAGAARLLDWPMPRLATGLGLRGIASAAMDLSDGLAGDLGHLLAASGRRLGQALGAELQAGDLPLAPSLQALPKLEALNLALHGGDDYELLFTAAPAEAGHIRNLCPAARCIGRIVAGRAMLLVEADGGRRPLDPRGHDHFSS